MNLNKVMLCGKVNGQIRIVGEGDNQRADIPFVVNDREQDNNRQWVDVPNYMTLYAFGQKVGVFQKHVVDGQELIIDGKLKTWKNADGSDGFGVIVFNVELGFKPRRDGGQSTGNGSVGGPPM